MSCDIAQWLTEWERGLPIQRSPYGTFEVYVGYRKNNPAPGWAPPPQQFAPWPKK